MTESADPTPTPPAATPPKRRGLLIAGLVAAGVLVVGGIGAAGAAVNAIATAAPHPSTPPVTVSTAGFPSGGKNPGIFTDTCKLVLTATNDPILMPGMTGESMQHDFFGNLAPTSSSTPSSLVGGSTKCSTSADSSAYWTPVLYQDGTAVEPSATLIYWRAPSTSAASVKTMPAGITMIAGNESATAPQNPRVIGWTCSGEKSMKLAGAPTDCPQGSDLRLVATFPNCWDGHTLDGSTQQNVVYAGASGACPSSHPIQVPQVVMHVNYPTSSAAGLTLSIGPTQQGSIFTGHADFMDGWNQPAMDRDVTACVGTQTRCGQVTGAMATPKGGKEAAN